MRFPWLGTTLVPPRQHHVAATGRRQRHRGVQDRRPQRSGNDWRIHLCHGGAAERTYAPHSAKVAVAAQKPDEKVVGPPESTAGTPDVSSILAETKAVTTIIQL